MAVLSVIFATVLLMGLGVAIVLLGSSEHVLASHDRTVRALREASIAAVHLAVADLRRQPSWSAVLLSGAPPLSAVPGRATGPTMTPPAPWGGPPLDLTQLTVDVSAAADTGSGDTQLWRLYEHGALPGLIPGWTAGPFYVAAWVADDPADGDGNPEADRNGVLAIRAAALGPGDAKVLSAVSVRKWRPPSGPDQVRILTIRTPP